MGGNKNQHNGRTTSGQTATPPSQGGVNVQPVNITRPPTYTLTVGFEVNYPTAFDGTTQNLGLEDRSAVLFLSSPKYNRTNGFINLVSIG